MLTLALSGGDSLLLPELICFFKTGIILFFSEEELTAEEEDRKRFEGSFSFTDSERGESVMVGSEGDEDGGLSLIVPKISLA